MIEYCQENDIIMNDLDTCIQHTKLLRFITDKEFRIRFSEKEEMFKKVVNKNEPADDQFDPLFMKGMEIIRGYMFYSSIIYNSDVDDLLRIEKKCKFSHVALTYDMYE